MAVAQQLIRADPELFDGANQAHGGGTRWQQVRGEAAGSPTAGAAHGERLLQQSRGADPGEAQQYECKSVRRLVFVFFPYAAQNRSLGNSVSTKQETRTFVEHR